MKQGHGACLFCYVMFCSVLFQRLTAPPTWSHLDHPPRSLSKLRMYDVTLFAYVIVCMTSSISYHRVTSCLLSVVVRWCCCRS